jgi:nucleotide-binding universal stress UspA family protein
MSGVPKKSDGEPHRAAPAKRDGSKAEPGRELALHILLVPLDFSEMSLQALQYAGPLAIRFQASLCLVHTVEKSAYLNDLDNVSVMLSEQEISNKALARLKRLARSWQAHGLTVDCRIAKGRAYQAICEVADAIGADLIIISTHGYTGFKKALLGSTTERVVQQAPCPVLVVRQSHHPAGRQKSVP